MTSAPVVLSGYGPVGKRFAELLGEQELGAHVAAIRGASTEILLGPRDKIAPREQWRPLAGIEETLDRTGARVLVQAVPSSAEALDRAAHEATTALRRGIDVVSATKSHLLERWRPLLRAALAGGGRIRISAATGAALPAADLARQGVRGLGCVSVRACPNGTSTFVLDRLGEGWTISGAVRDAQARGIAEADPRADLDGSDAATKLRLLAGLLWDWDVTGISVDLERIDASAADAAARAARSGMRLRAVASVSLLSPMNVRVALETLAPGDPLFHITGPEKAMVFHCPDAGDIAVQGGRSSPTGAALALLKDLLNLLGGHEPGFR